MGRSIEVGHTFQLGTRYSEPLKTTFVDEDGMERLFQMGCYGLGVSRVIAAVAEQHGDDNGLRWPKAVAPFHAVVVTTNMDQPEVVEAAERAYRELRDVGIESVLDDREVSAGVKFADADLIGYPLQVVVGKRGLDSGTVDAKVRATGERRQLPLQGLASGARDILAEAP
jgi:prolyl-tRNA synthetase